MKKTIIYSFLLILVLLGANTLFQSSSSTSNDTVTAVKDVKEFNRIVMKGRGNLHIMQMDDESLKVVGSKDVVRRVKVNVQYGELVISLKKPGWFTGMFASKEFPDYYLHVKDLSSVKVLGAGTVNSEGVLKGDELSFSIDGSGKIAAKVNGKKLNVTLFGSGEMNLLGEVDDLNLIIHGSGKFFGDKLDSKRANITIEGAGDAVVNVKDSLDVKILGSGRISYKGKPKINKHISGSGSVVPLK